MPRNKLLLLFGLNLTLISVIGVLEVLGANFYIMVIHYLIIFGLNMIGFLKSITINEVIKGGEESSSFSEYPVANKEIMTDLDSELERRKAQKIIERN